MKAGGGADAGAVDERLLDRLSTVLGHRFATALLGRPTKAAEDSLSEDGTLIGAKNREEVVI